LATHRSREITRITRFLWAAGVGFLLLAAAQVAAPSSKADALQQPVDKSASVSLDLSQGKLITLPAPASNVFIADPGVADIQVATPERVFVFGRKAGRTTLYALGAGGVLLKSIAVEVHNQSAKAQQLVSLNPATADIHVGSTDNGVTLQGPAVDPASAMLANRAASDYAADKDKIDDRMKVRGSVQVQLRVRIAEMNRTITKELGFNWNALFNFGNFQLGLYTGRTLFSNGLFNPAPPLNSGGQPGSLIFGNKAQTMDAVIDALAEENLVTILAEPNLTALSGETASFLAGGEFPVPVSQALGTISIEFKPYGVGLNFVPTVLSSNHISLRVRPEVSQISSQGAITLNGLQIPALTVRRAETTIELGSGQSFAIAGLLQDNTSNDMQRFPGLGDLPVLGALFRSSSFQRNESELVIIVTPYIVKPIDDPKEVRLPTDAWRPATDIERVFYGDLADPQTRGAMPTGSASSGASGLPHLVGDAGFEVE
jgi:pilus assembly protein CpaC